MFKVESQRERAWSRATNIVMSLASECRIIIFWPQFIFDGSTGANIPHLSPALNIRECDVLNLLVLINVPTYEYIASHEEDK